MPYQPTFPSPYLTSIDVTKPETCIIKCLINPRDVISEYYINILDADESKMVGMFYGRKGYKSYYDYSSGKYIQLSTIPDTDSTLPIYGSYDNDSWLITHIPNEILASMKNGTNYKWYARLIGNSYNTLYSGAVVLDSERTRLVYVSYDFFERYHELNDVYFSSRMLFKYKGNTYKITYVSGQSDNSYAIITLENAIDSYEGDTFEIITDIVKSQEYYFYARTSSNLKFSDPPETVNSISHTFNATYSQQENASISYYRFRLYCDGELVDNTNKIYSSTIKYTYDKFVSGHNYSLEVELEDEYGNIDTVTHVFSVVYNQNISMINPEVSVNRQGCVNINYSTLSRIDGTGENYGFIDSDTISINSNGYVCWDKTDVGKAIQIPYDSTTIFKQHFHKGFNGDICCISSKDNVFERISVWYDGEKFWWQNGTLSPMSIDVYTATESALDVDGIFEVSDDTRYIINSSDTINSTDTIITNDTLYNYWWYIIIRPRATDEEVKIIRGEAYQ